MTGVTMTDATTRDLVVSAANEQPIDFKKVVDDLLVDKVRDAIAGKRAEMAAAALEQGDDQDHEQGDNSDQAA